MSTSPARTVNCRVSNDRFLPACMAIGLALGNFLFQGFGTNATPIARSVKIGWAAICLRMAW